ncbi:MAG TPA: MFS transporter [Acidimicrobiales bacterium]|jgi:dTMP kinase|nr:MFS transporter [Acidimicrobiales bacterium]
MEAHDHEAEDPSEVVESLRALHDRRVEGASFIERFFGTSTFFRLWLAQALSSLGDWLAFLAIVILAGRLGAESPGTAVGLVMAARIIPGFFLAAAAGVLIDRRDRKHVMVASMLVRAAVVGSLPFVDTVAGLILASLVLELATLFFSPAKEATVPNLVPVDKLATANSLGLAAAYGTFPLSAGLFALLAEVAEWLAGIDAFNSLRTSQEAVAFYATAVCYVVAAVIIYRLAIPTGHMRTRDERRPVGLGQVLREVREGWHYAFITPVVRAVNVGLACGLIGGGMLIPLGQAFSEQVLGSGPSGFGVFVFALGVGTGAGVVSVSALQSRLPKARTFVLSLFCAGGALLVGASMSSLELAAMWVAVMGVFAGSVYVLGFTLLHESVEDEVRGRIFAALYTLVRLCVLLALVVGPLLIDVLDSASERLVDGRIEVGVEIAVPGVRLTLWLAAVIMLVAGALSRASLRASAASRSDSEERTVAP